MTDEAAEPSSPTPPPVERRRLTRWIALGLAAIVGLAALGILAARLAVLTPTGRAVIAARLEGLQLGAFGRLHIEGLDGDVLRDFSLRRVAIVDARGPWLDARDVRVRWDWPSLLVRRVRIEAVGADSVLIARQPIQTQVATSPIGPMPVSVTLEAVHLRLETLPAISVKRGLFQVAGRLDIERRGGLGGELHAASLLRRGDGLDGRFNFGLGQRLRLDARAWEAKGGAIAGLAGLAADRSFRLDAHAIGAADQGVLRLAVLSGDQSLARIDGGWTSAGGAGQGRVSLAASRWTAGWMRQFGPELRLFGHGRGLGGGRYDLALQAASDNATVAVSGVLDARAQSAPAGLKVQASVTDLSRIVSAPAMGRGVLNGTVFGRVGDWRLASDLSVERLAMAGYSLGRVAGPTELAYVRGEWRLKASLKGSGGQGRGLLGALAGAAPRASLETTRLADGRLLLKSLSADGSGIKLQASGERTLFGALNLRGQGQVSNLAAARAGARGQINVRWSAGQARTGGAWTLTADAAGAGLATGEGELDRLLGAKPAFSLAASYAKDTLSVTKASLIGAAAKLSAAGQIGKAGALKLALDWSAEGPFDAGPVEIAGQAKGGGALTGTLAAPRADLLADFERIDLPQLTLKPAHVVLSLARSPAGADGLISIAAGSDYGLAHGRAALHFAADGIDLTDVDAAAGGASIAGSLALRNAAPSAADLTIAVGPGAFASEGHAQARLKIAGAPGAAVGDIKLDADNLVVRGSDLTIAEARFSAEGSMAHLPYSLSATASGQGWPIKLSGSGVLSESGQGYMASFSGSGRVRQADLRTLSPASIMIDGPHRSARLDLAIGGGEALISGEQTNAVTNAKATLTGVDLSALGEDMAGKITASIALSGQGANLDGTLDARLQDARSRDAPEKLALDATVHAALAASKVNLNAQINGAASSAKADFSLVMPADASAAPFHLALDRNRPIAGQFDASGELQPIWQLLYGGDQSLGGALTAHGGVEGTLAAPRLVGEASLANGRFEDAGTGLKLRNLTANVDLSQSEVDVRRFSGTDAKTGTVSGSGHFSLAAAGQSTLTLDVKGFQLLDNDDAKAAASGAVTVTRAADGKIGLSGALTIDQATISAATRTPPGVETMDVIERNRPLGQQTSLQAPASAAGPEVDLDIDLRAPRRVFVRGLGLNAELSLNAHVGGTLADPALSGVAQVVRGDYDFAGKRFEIDDQGVVNLATSPDQIRLNLSASWDTSSLTAVIKITGTASKPVITLTSTPILPQDEVLSQVLFGSSAAQLSPVEAAQLAAAVTTLATGGGFDVMGGLSHFARLDRVALGGDETTGVTVSGGKYIGNHLYLELTGGGRYGPSAQVEYRANRAFSVISQVGGLGGAKLSLRWRHDFGKVTGVGKPSKPKP